MSDEYKVLAYWCNQGEDQMFTIVVPLRYPYPECHPLTHFQHAGFSVPIEARTVTELKDKLRAMLKACKNQPMRLIPEKIVPAKVEQL